MPPLRLVLDTNIVVSAVRSPSGSLTWIREAWRARLIVPLISPATMSELVRVIAYSKFRLTRDDQARLLSDYISSSEFAEVDKDADIPECRDPSDAPFLRLALSGKADAIVTGDQDLLAMSPEFSVPILSAQEARARLPSA